MGETIYTQHIHIEGGYSGYVKLSQKLTLQNLKSPSKMGRGNEQSV